MASRFVPAELDRVDDLCECEIPPGRNPYIRILKPPANAILAFALIAALAGLVPPVYGTLVSIPLMFVAVPLSLWAYGTDNDRSIATKGKIALGACGISVVLQTMFWILAFN